jgi:lipid II:glycine glycyltransferase (peptidoglycan interpeptide bridge formation enzyme)
MSSFKFTTENYSDKHQKFLDENMAPLTQYGFYGEWQKSIGREIFTYTITDESDQINLFLQAVAVPIGFGKKFLYCPYGPVLNSKIVSNKKTLTDTLEALKTGLKTYLKQTGYSFVRLDFCPNIDDFMLNTGTIGLRIAPKYARDGSFFQPRVEWALDLDNDIETIYNSIDSKNRYAIRLAERKNIKIEIITENILDYFETFYEMISDTAKRNSFGLHKREYYLEVFKSLDKNKNGRLVISKVEDQIATCLVFVDYNRTTMFLFGGSSTELNKKIPTSHLSHWKNIEYSKNAGLKIYNFGGVENEKHPSIGLRSLTKFKKRFGGYEIEHSMFYDLINQKIIYRIFLLKKLIRYLKNIFLER